MSNMVLIAALCGVLASTSLHAQDNSVEARLRKLEEEVLSLKKENEQLRRDLGLEVVARQADVRMAGRASSLQVGGLIQAQSEAGDRGDTRFSDANTRTFLRRARINAGGRFLEEFNFRAELELAGSLANATGFRAQLTDAFINWNRFESANVRIGQFKTPFGFEQLYADPRLLTAERTLVNDRLTPGRQLGVQVGGQMYYERFQYAAGVFNGSGTNQNFNDNNELMTAARVSVAPFSGRLLGEQAPAGRSASTVSAPRIRTSLWPPTSASTRRRPRRPKTTSSRGTGARSGTTRSSSWGGSSCGANTSRRRSSPPIGFRGLACGPTGGPHRRATSSSTRGCSSSPGASCSTPPTSPTPPRRARRCWA